MSRAVGLPLLVLALAVTAVTAATSAGAAQLLRSDFSSSAGYMSGEGFQGVFILGEIAPGPSGAPGIQLCAGSMCGALVFDCTAFGILSLLDIPDDEGRQLRVRWCAHPEDDPVSVEPVRSYSLYREIGGAAAAPGQPGGAQRVPGYDFVLAVPGGGEIEYNAIAPTLCDSTISQGQCLSTFFVRAHTDDSFVFYDSAPASGYSIDNLAPLPPQGLVAAYAQGVDLQWEESAAADFFAFRVYRGSTADFVPQPGNRLAETGGTSFSDPLGTAAHFYKLGAVDHSGNESAAVSPSTVTGTPPLAISRWALGGAAPNPFNPRTQLQLRVPGGGGWATLEVLDARGHRVRTLHRGELAGGEHPILWTGTDDRGQPVASGIYYLLLRAGGEAQSQKVALVR